MIQFKNALLSSLGYCIPLAVIIFMYGYIWNKYNLSGVILTLASLYTLNTLVQLVNRGDK